jgi:hypothetical protein
VKKAIAAAAALAVFGLGGIALAEGSPEDPVEIQTELTIPPPPSVEEIEEINEDSVVLFEDVLWGYEEFTQGNFTYKGSPACYSSWETQIMFEDFGARTTSHCFAWAEVADPATAQFHPVTVVGTIETFFDGSTFVWGFDIQSYDELLDTEYQIPQVQLDPDGNPVPQD